MIHTVSCPQCSQTAKVPEESLGKMARCRKCGSRFKLSTTNVPPALNDVAWDALPPMLSSAEVVKPFVQGIPSQPPRLATAPEAKSDQVLLSRLAKLRDTLGGKSVLIIVGVSLALLVAAVFLYGAMSLAGRLAGGNSAGLRQIEIQSPTGAVHTTSEWFNKLESHSQSKNVLVKQQLSGIESWLKPDPAAVTVLLDAYADFPVSSRVHSVAEAVLNRFDDSPDLPPVSMLIDYLGHSNPAVQSRAVHLIGLHRADAHIAADQIKPLMTSPDDKLRTEATFALLAAGDLGPEEYVELLAAKDYRVRQRSVAEIAKLSANTKASLVPKVAEQLASNESNDRVSALEALLIMDAPLNQVAPRIAERYATFGTKEISKANEYLSKSCPGFIPYFDTFLRDLKQPNYDSLCVLLRSFGPEAALAVPFLVDAAVASPDLTSALAQVLEVLIAIGPEARAEVSRFDVFFDEKGRLHELATRTCFACAGDSPTAVPISILAIILESQHTTLLSKDLAVLALKEHGSAAVQVLPLLTETHVRAMAMIANMTREKDKWKPNQIFVFKNYSTQDVQRIDVTTLNKGINLSGKAIQLAWERKGYKLTDVEYHGANPWIARLEDMQVHAHKLKEAIAAVSSP